MLSLRELRHCARRFRDHLLKTLPQQQGRATMAQHCRTLSTLAFMHPCQICCSIKRQWQTRAFPLTPWGGNLLWTFTYFSICGCTRSHKSLVAMHIR